MKTGRRRAAAIEAANRGERYTLAEACRRVKELSFARFDESVDLAVPTVRRSLFGGLFRRAA